MSDYEYATSGEREQHQNKLLRDANATAEMWRQEAGKAWACLKAERELIATLIENYCREVTNDWDECQECGIRWAHVVEMIRSGRSSWK